MGGTPATPPGMRVRTGRFERLSSLTHSRSVLRSCLVASAAPAPTTTTFADFSLRQCRLPFRNKARPPQVRVAHRERRARSGVYLTSGGKNGRDIGETVKSALPSSSSASDISSPKSWRSCSLPREAWLRTPCWSHRSIEPHAAAPCERPIMT